MIDAGLPVPAHTYVLKCSHAFNVLDARGAVVHRRAGRTRSPGCGASPATWPGCGSRAATELGHPLGTVEPPPAAAAVAAAPPAVTGAAARWSSRSAPRRCRRRGPRAPRAASSRADRAARRDPARARRDPRPTPRRGGWSLLVADVSAAARRTTTRMVRGPQVRPRTTPTATHARPPPVRPRPGGRRRATWSESRSTAWSMWRVHQARAPAAPAADRAGRSAGAGRHRPALGQEHALVRPGAWRSPGRSAGWSRCSATRWCRSPSSTLAAGRTTRVHRTADAARASRCPAPRTYLDAAPAHGIVADAGRAPASDRRPARRSWPPRPAARRLDGRGRAGRPDHQPGGAADARSSAASTRATWSCPTGADHGDAQAPALPAGPRRRRAGCCRTSSRSPTVLSSRTWYARATRRCCGPGTRTPPSSGGPTGDAARDDARADQPAGLHRQARLDGRPGRPDRRRRADAGRAGQPRRRRPDTLDRRGASW